VLVSLRRVDVDVGVVKVAVTLTIIDVKATTLLDLVCDVLVVGTGCGRSGSSAHLLLSSKSVYCCRSGGG
jgi:hypothetical protein